jgi:predicted porin
VLKALSSSLCEIGEPTMKNIFAHPALRLFVLLPGLLLGSQAKAYDYGPFSFNGFVKVEGIGTSDYCDECQARANENRQRYWADPLVQGAEYGWDTRTFTLIQPYVGVKFDLDNGFKVGGLISQRWRDGGRDFPGFWYERNICVSNDDYGSVRIGAMPTRSWSVADYPYAGSYNPLSDAWASSGAGYGLLTRALRIATRPLDVADGNLVLEATYDIGKEGWSKNDPSLLELYAQYAKGGLVIDAIFQDSRNGTPSAFGHGPFTGLTPFPRDDELLGKSSQRIAMIMARYQVDSNIEVSGGLRANRWSGAYARITVPENPNTGTGVIQLAQWNEMFNVDWGNDLGGGIFKGYPATSLDLSLGALYRIGPWTASTNLVHLGSASTDNPYDRGQSNSATLTSVGLNYNFRNGFEAYGSLGLVNYAKQGLAPLTMPAHHAFSEIDSRVTDRGYWLVLGGVFTF